MECLSLRRFCFHEQGTVMDLNQKGGRECLGFEELGDEQSLATREHINKKRGEFTPLFCISV